MDCIGDNVNLIIMMYLNMNQKTWKIKDKNPSEALPLYKYYFVRFSPNGYYTCGPTCSVQICHLFIYLNYILDTFYHLLPYVLRISHILTDQILSN